MVDRNSAPEEFACIWQSKLVGINTIGTEKNINSLFQATFSWLSAVVVSLKNFLINIYASRGWCKREYLLKAEACIFWKNIFSFQTDSNLKSDGNFISNWKFPDCVHFFGAWATQAMIETIALVYEHMKRTLEMCSLIGHNNTKHFFGPNQELASAWSFGNGLVRVGTQGLFRPYLKTFVPPFLLTRLTAPGSPRMTLSTKCVLAFVKYKKRIWCAYRTLFHFSIKFPLGFVCHSFLQSIGSELLF